MKVPKRRCLIQLKKTAGVQAQLIAPYLREDHGKIWLYPLSRRLFPHEEAAMWRFLQAQIGKNYDLHGAIRAGGWVYALLNGLFRNGGRSRLNELFCSELGAGSHNTSGLYLTGNASRWSPNKYCRRTRLAGVFQRPYRIDGCLTCDQSLPSCCR